MSNLNPNAKEMLEMRTRGATLQEIADKYGVTRQAIHITLKNYTDRLSGKRFGLDVNKIIYKGIADYFLAHPDESMSSFSRKIFGCGEGIRPRDLRKNMFGEHEMYLSINQIKKICEVVGKPFEEVFELRGEEE
jgi:DNA-binding XRE family transcriptional regulator